MEVRMEGRCALITGGSMGLGRAMGKKFAGAGAAVALVARGADPLAQAKAEIEQEGGGGAVGIYPCDVTDPAQIEAVFAKIVGDFGKVDILVNNAGMARALPFEEIGDETWQADFDLKVFAAIRLARLALPGMKERRWGRIINVLNSQAKAPKPNSAPTSVTRAAGMALTKVLAGECAAHNVLVNALCTGLIESDQWARRHATLNAGGSYQEYLAKMGKGVPMGRMGRADEFANLACFLASDAGSYVTGTAINLDGGLSPVV